MIFTYTPNFQFDFYRGLNDLTRHPFGLTERLDGDRYQTIIFDNLVTVIQKSSSNKLIIEVTDSSPINPDLLLNEIKNRFGLCQDMAAFYQFARKDQYLASVVRKLMGLAMFQKSSMFEMLVTAITDQQLNVSFATTLKQRLITNYGEKHNYNGVELWTFPTPQRIAELEEEALRPYQFSGAKSKYIIRLAKGIVDSTYPLEEWSQLNDEDLLKALISIYGVGQWTAEYSAMVGYNRQDFIPAADIGLMRAVQKCYKLDHRPTEMEVRDIAESWRPWRSLVTYYLWHAYE